MTDFTFSAFWRIDMFVLLGVRAVKYPYSYGGWSRYLEITLFNLMLSFGLHWGKLDESVTCSG